MGPGEFFKRQRELVHAAPDFLWVDRGEPHLQSFARKGLSCATEVNA
jgi:hypothetical protein